MFTISKQLSARSLFKCPSLSFFAQNPQSAGALHLPTVQKAKNCVQVLSFLQIYVTMKMIGGLEASPKYK